MPFFSFDNSKNERWLHSDYIMDTKSFCIVVMQVCLINLPFFLFQNDFDGNGFIGEDKEIAEGPVKLLF